MNYRHNIVFLMICSQIYSFVTFYKQEVIRIISWLTGNRSAFIFKHKLQEMYSSDI